MRNLALKDLMENHLHGKKATVRSGVTGVRASIEGEVFLNFYHDGLQCLTTLQWNSYKVAAELKKQLKDLFKYSDYEEVFSIVDGVINTFEVQIGHISYYGAKDFHVVMEDCSYKKDTQYIRSVYITHTSGSVTEITLNRPE